MSEPMYPLKFDPIYQYRIWGGRNLQPILSKPLPPDDPIGEAWLLSDRKEEMSTVKEGPLKGTSIARLMKDYPREIMGKLDKQYENFPLLLKFLDCKQVLSVQVHPSDHQKELLPKGDTGKTEAWVVLETLEDSRIYAGLKKGTSKEDLKRAIENNTVADCLHSFVPKKDDAVFIHSGTVHTLGGTMVFEVQENSDTTFRLYDWDRTDPKTGKPRELQVEKAIASIDFDQVEIGPVKPKKDPDNKDAEKLFDNEHFRLWRINTKENLEVGFEGEPAILVCTAGGGKMEYKDTPYYLSKGEVMLLPASIGCLDLKPEAEITFLQIRIPPKK